MRSTEHLSGGISWPARDLYLADEGECPACRKTFNGVEPIHDRGEGVPRNLATAAIWYSEAADRGDEIAAERLEELRAETRDIFKGMRFV